MGSAAFLDDTTPIPKQTPGAGRQAAEAAFFAAITASGTHRGKICMNGATWKLVSCSLAPYGGIGEADEWGAIWFDSWRLKLHIDKSMPDGEVVFRGE